MGLTFSTLARKSTSSLSQQQSTLHWSLRLAHARLMERPLIVHMNIISLTQIAVSPMPARKSEMVHTAFVCTSLPSRTVVQRRSPVPPHSPLFRRRVSALIFEFNTHTHTHIVLGFHHHFHFLNCTKHSSV